MKNIVLFNANDASTQAVLATAYTDNKDFISYDEESDTYDFITIAKYPHVYAKNGKKSLITMKLTDAQYDFIEALPSAIDILAECDNNPDSDYTWLGGGAEAKFKSVVGQDFFSGSGTIGEEDYIAPRTKLAVLA